MTAAALLEAAIKSQRRSGLEDLMAQQLTAIKIDFVREFKFHPTRKWRFDFWLPALNLAVEVEGGIYTGGRHTRPGGLNHDAHRYAEALCLGFRVLRVTGAQVESGQALLWIERAGRDNA